MEAHRRGYFLQRLARIASVVSPQRRTAKASAQEIQSVPVLKNAQHEKYAQNVAKGTMVLVDAYEAAGYRPDRSRASTLRWKRHVAERIEELQKAGAERALVTIEDVVKELAKVAFSNMADFMQGDGNGGIFTDLKALTIDQSAVLSEVTVDTAKEGRGDDSVDIRKVKFKLHDKLGALDKLARYLGMFKDKDATPPPAAGPTVIILPANGRDAPADDAAADDAED